VWHVAWYDEEKCVIYEGVCLIYVCVLYYEMMREVCLASYVMMRSVCSVCSHVCAIGSNVAWEVML